jgi:hypothetical protein
MYFGYGFCAGNERVVVEENRRPLSDQKIPCMGVILRVNQKIRQTGCIPRVSVPSEGEIVSDMNTQQIMLEVVQGRQ